MKVLCLGFTSKINLSENICRMGRHCSFHYGMRTEEVDEALRIMKSGKES